MADDTESNSVQVSQSDVIDALDIEASQQPQDAEVTDAPTEEHVETPETSPDGESEDQSQDDTPQETEETLSEETLEKSDDAQDEIDYGLVDKLEAGAELTEEDLAAIQELKDRSVPYKAFTQLRQKDKEALRQAQENAEKSNASLKEKADYYEKVLPILEALQDSPEAQALLEAKLSSNAEAGKELSKMDPKMAPLLEKTERLEAQIASMQAQQGEREIETFVGKHEDLKDDPYLKSKWEEFSLVAAKAGQENPLEIGYQMAKGIVDNQRNADVSAKKKAVRKLQKEQAAVPSGKGKAPEEKELSPEEQVLGEILSVNRQVLPGVEFTPQL